MEEKLRKMKRAVIGNENAISDLQTRVEKIEDFLKIDESRKEIRKLLKRMKG